MEVNGNRRTGEGEEGETKAVMRKAEDGERKEGKDGAQKKEAKNGRERWNWGCGWEYEESGAKTSMNVTASVAPSVLAEVLRYNR